MLSEYCLKPEFFCGYCEFSFGSLSLSKGFPSCFDRGSFAYFCDEFERFKDRSFDIYYSIALFINDLLVESGFRSNEFIAFNSGSFSRGNNDPYFTRNLFSKVVVIKSR